MDAGERALLGETVAAAIAAAGRPNAAAVDTALAGLGWREMLTAEPRDAIEIVFGALGAANATATILDDVLTSAVGAPARDDLTVLLPRFAAWDPPGSIDGEGLHAVGLASARIAAADDLLVVCTAGTGLRTAIVPRRATTIDAVHGVDPDGGLRVVRVEYAAVDTEAIDATTWDAAVASGRRALAATSSSAPTARCWIWHAPTPWTGCSSVARSRGSRPCDTGWPTRSSPSRPSRRPWARPGTSPDRTPPRSRRQSPGGRAAPSRRSANRCSRASASRRTIRSTAT